MWRSKGRWHASPAAGGLCALPVQAALEYACRTFSSSMAFFTSSFPRHFPGGYAYVSATSSCLDTLCISPVGSQTHALIFQILLKILIIYKKILFSAQCCQRHQSGTHTTSIPRASQIRLNYICCFAEQALAALFSGTRKATISSSVTS